MVYHPFLLNINTDFSFSFPGVVKADQKKISQGLNGLTSIPDLMATNVESLSGKDINRCI